MFNLTNEQQEFLSANELDIRLLFDAKWMWPKDYRKMMKILEKRVAINVSPCKAEWHSMRTRSWHCLQCNPSSLVYELRYAKDYYIYVAASKENDLLKIWLTKDPGDRESHLNKDTYGGIDDWKIIYYAFFPKWWDIENKIHQELSIYRYQKEYNYYGKNIKCYEIFSCGFAKVKDVLNKIKQQIWNEKIKDEREIDWIDNFNFPDIESDNIRLGTQQNKEEEIIKPKNNIDKAIFDDNEINNNIILNEESKEIDTVFYKDNHLTTKSKSIKKKQDNTYIIIIFIILIILLMFFI